MRALRRSAALLCVLLANAAFAAPVACPYTPAELAASFGKAFRGGKAQTATVPGGTQATCTYQQDRSSLVLTMMQTAKAESVLRREQAAFEQGLTGKLAPIAADPDGATWQTDIYQPNFMALHYRRGGNRVELRVTGASFRVAEMQPKLLRLRRLR